MTSKDRALLCAQGGLDKRAENVRVLDLEGRSSFTDYFVICSGFSDRQVAAIADSIQSKLREKGIQPIAVEGYSEGRWVLIDLGDVVVHVFLDSLRDYYQLEDLWRGAKPIAIPSEYYFENTGSGESKITKEAKDENGSRPSP